MRNIFEWVTADAKAVKDKTAFADKDSSMTYGQLFEKASAAGTFIAKQGIFNSPVAVLLKRGTDCISAMMSVLASGNFYTVLDDKMPADRMKKIIDTLHPSIIITQDDLSDTAFSLLPGKAYIFDEMIKTEPDMKITASARARLTADDLAYVLFTSGSTGTPKGVAVSHLNVISYTDWFASAFDINGSTVFGSQTPFYFSMSVSDIYSTLCKGAEFQIIDKSLFSFPVTLVDFLNERRVNTVYWVPSAMSLIANLDVFRYKKPEFLEKILFAGEQMPCRQYNYWKKYYPDALFANLFGPTETTDICTYYISDREFTDTQVIPMGNPCENCDVFVLKDDGTISDGKAGDEGELMCAGPFVAKGYYNDPVKTAAAFIKDPRKTAYPGTVYATGDLVRYNDLGELEYISRIDHQIKRMGYRIELGEIEAAASAVKEITMCVVLFDHKKNQIVLFYTGSEADTSLIISEMKKRLPGYMMPDRIEYMKRLPFNSNGKIDRKCLLNSFSA